MLKNPRVILGAALGLAGLYLLFYAWPRSDRDKDFHYREFGRLAVLNQGRVLPIDTFARTSLMALSHRQTLKELKDPDNEKAGTTTQPAVKWLLDSMVSPPPIPQEQDPRHELVRILHLMFKPGERGGPGYDHRVFRIENDEVLSLLGLEPRPELRYSFNEIRSAPNFDKFLPRVQAIGDNDSKYRTLADNKMLELYQSLSSFIGVNSLQGPLTVPLDAKGENWDALGMALLAGLQNRNPDPATQAYFTMLLAYREGDTGKFNEALDKYHGHLQKEMPAVMSTARLEAYFNEFAPFYHAAVLYGFLFVLVCVSWLTRSETLRSAAFWTTLLVLAVHTWALCVRMYITGRPPVTNLYSSAVFIGWGCVGTCLVAEWLFRNGLALAVGVVTGGLSLIVAHILGLSGDTMEVLQAVLDTNFWLATHVTCITLGYTATFVAGFMGIAYILLGRFTPLLRYDLNSFFGNGEPGRPGETIGVMLSKATYGVLCFAMFLSFTGTVLGGIWADQSWGRFWGWDPKENGALLIVLWVALILHARWAGMIKARGIAVLAVLGNCITAWSWFGTNLLGIGLHAYGFMQGAMTGLILFVGTQLVIAALGLGSMKGWRSFAPPSAASLPEPAAAGGRGGPKVPQPV